MSAVGLLANRRVFLNLEVLWYLVTGLSDNNRKIPPKQKEHGVQVQSKSHTLGKGHLDIMFTSL